MTYIGKFNKLLRQICQLETNNYYSDAQILDQFIAGLKDKLIKKIHPHAPKDLNSVIQHAKRYEMAMEEANHTKLVNLAIGETSSAAEEKIDQLTKKVENYFTNQQQQQLQRYQPPQRQNQNNFAPLFNNQSQNCHYCGISGHWKKDCRKLQRDQQNRSNQHYSPLQQSYYQPPLPTYYSSRPQYPISARRLITQNQFTPQNQYQVNNNRISLNNQLVLRNSTQPKPNHYHTQPSYLTMPEEQNSYHTALLEGRATAQQQNLFYNHTTIPPVRIAENTNFSNIFSFEFEANESPFLLSSAAANKQKAITAIYTEAETEKKLIHLILDSGSARIIVIADGMKKTPVGEIDNFLFTLNGITIPVKVLVMDALQYQALVGNDWLQKANTKLDWKTQELQISYQGQHARVPVTCSTFNKCSEKAPAFEFELEEEKPIIKTFMALGSTSNWANKTEQQYFSNDSLETKKPDNTPCLICEDMLPEEYNWIDVAMRGGVCDQTCQYALSISEKVKRGTPFNAAYNSALNKLYHYPHDVEMIFDLAMALINRATKKDVRQMKEAKYIEYTMELAGFDYENKVKVYHQITSHTYPTQEAQIQRLEQINIRLCKKCIMPCDKKWCFECYALSISLPSKNNENEIEFREPEATKKIGATPIYLIKNQYPDKNTLVLKPKSLTKINLKIAFKIPPGAIIQREQLEKSEKGTNGFGLTGRFTVPVNIALNEQKIGVIHNNIFQQELPQTVSDFPEIIGHLLPKINPKPSSKNYHIVIEKLSRINMRQLESQQQNQLKELIAEFADIFAENNNDLGRTDLVQH
ncbi:hypothetical protein G9A89_004198 [Geosiphon pyriformis]|nr:hypothetical protein G9A89_004198 [Geosiphon pyriformis]